MGAEECDCATREVADCYASPLACLSGHEMLTVAKYTGGERLPGEHTRVSRVVETLHLDPAVEVQRGSTAADRLYDTCVTPRQGNGSRFTRFHIPDPQR